MIDNIIIQQLEENKNKEIFFWGASNFLKDFISKNDVKKYNIVGILDFDDEKQDTELCGYKIFIPSEILNHNKAKIVFTVKNNHIDTYRRTYKVLKDLNSEKALLPDIFIELKNQGIISNKIYLVNEYGKREIVSYIPGLRVNWTGINSTIEIGENPLPVFANCNITVGANSLVKIGSSMHKIANLDINIQDNSKVIIGKDFSCLQASFCLTCEADKKITVGDNCMFSRDIIIRTSDAHAILDAKTNKPINKGGNIYIGNNVWIAQRVMVLKNAHIADGCVVSANSMVNKKFKKENTLIGGYPAKILKEGIKWARQDVNYFLK